MAEEAQLLIVARMRDEASQQMASFGNTMGSADANAEGLQSSLSTVDSQMVSTSATTQAATMQMQQMQMTLTATGSALAAIGSLMNQMESPQAKMVANFLMIAGAILTTTSAIMMALPYIAQLTASLRSLAIVQSIIAALSGPRGWAMLGVGAAVGIGAGVGIARLTGGGAGGGGGVTVVNNIGGSVITERELGEITRKEIVKSQERNSSSGIR